MEIIESSYQFPTTNADLKTARSLTIHDQELVDVSFTFVPGGVFLMGSADDELLSRANEKPKHEVSINEFWIGTWPITNRQWNSVMGLSMGGELTTVTEDSAKVNVWLDEAHAFLERLSDLSGMTARLPCESEWEYACRAGTNSAYAFGDSISEETVNHNAKEGPWKVGSSRVANPFGLYDMHGCVWEWCSDVWHSNYQGAPTDGTSWESQGDASYVVQRGGAWNSNARSCRSASRVGDVARNSENIVGIRVAISA